MNQKARYLLAIESAIAGGSISIFRDRDVAASRCGEGAVSRAEDLLPNIIAMLEETGISKSGLSRIAISLGPGSYTGLRIGIATVMGLKRGLDLEYVGVPLFEALASGVSEAIIAVPMGKADVCFAASEEPVSPKVAAMEAFVETIRNSGSNRVLVHPALQDRLMDLVDIAPESLGPNLSEYVGRAAMTLPGSEALSPMYIQNPRFG